MRAFSFALKYIILSLFLTCISAKGFTESLQVLKTKYFDIIYSPSSKVTATLLYEHADAYAEEISSRLNKKIPHRYPVYISSKSEILNGYYTLFPYQRIVIYDATIGDGELGNSYDLILNVFYHELTHAISLWYYLPTLSLSFEEGVAVLFESRGDQGRLNDPLIMHHLMQNKIDKTTPTWREAAGHRDVYPGAFWAYIYGASFLSYLENIYGKTEYIKFFHNHFFVFPKGKTKHIFKKPLEELWKDFTDSISYPENIIKPEAFSKEKMGSSVIAQSKDGFACYDSTKKTVFFYDASGKRQKLFYAPSPITDLNFSIDGSFLLVTDVKDDWGKIKQRLSIYDIKAKRFLNKKKFSIRYASFVGEKDICAIKVEGQSSSIILLDFDLNEKETLFSCGPGLAYSQAYNLVYASNEKVAFIAANGLNRDMLLLDIKTKEIKKLQGIEDLPAIRYLKSSFIDDEVFLSFSWCNKGDLYRMALYDVKNDKLKILEENISAGVFQPIVFDRKDDVLKIAYIGIHGKYSMLYQLSSSILKEKTISLANFDLEKKEAISKAPNFEIAMPQKYNYFSWAWKVLPLPYLLPSTDWKSIGEWGFGAYLYGKDPTEFITFDVTPIFYVKPFFMDIGLNTYLDFTSFKLGFTLHDKNVGFVGRNTGFAVNAETSFSLDQINKKFTFGSRIGVSGSLKFPSDYLSYKTLYSHKYTDSFLSYSLYGRYSQFGKRFRLNSPFFAIDERGFSTSFKTDYFLNMNSKDSMFILQAMGNFAVPVVPIKMKIASYYGYNTYYSPSRGTFIFLGNRSFISALSYLPTMDEYQSLSKSLNVAKNNIGMSFDISVRIFSYEIQQGSNLFLIYFNRINFEIGYYSILNLALKADGKAVPTYFHSFYTDTYLDISGMVKLGVRYSQPIEQNVGLGKFSMLLKANIFF
ncbi:MAG: hypothetical protein ACTTKH_03085 [Treponema sp.]